MEAGGWYKNNDLFGARFVVHNFSLLRSRSRVIRRSKIPGETHNAAQRLITGR